MTPNPLEHEIRDHFARLNALKIAIARGRLEAVGRMTIAAARGLSAESLQKLVPSVAKNFAFVRIS
jgi:hypothetical protein